MPVTLPLALLPSSALKESLGAWNGGPSVDSCNSYCTYVNDNGTPVLNTTGPSTNLLRQDNFYRR
jgi:hypothetical protein